MGMDAMIIAGDMNLFPFTARYVPITGRKDIVFSCKAEPQQFRKLAQHHGYRDPFKNSDGTHQSLPGKLDWTLASPAFEWKRKDTQARTKAKKEQPSDHLYSFVEL